MDDLSYPNHRMKSKQFSRNSGNLRPNGKRSSTQGAVGGHAYQVRTVSHTEPPHRLMGCTQRWQRSQALSSVRDSRSTVWLHCTKTPGQPPPTPPPSQKCWLALTPLTTLSYPSLILDPPGPPQEGLGGDKTC